MGFSRDAPDVQRHLQERRQLRQDELSGKERTKVRRKKALEAQAEAARKRALQPQGQGGNTLTSSSLGGSGNERLGGF